MDESSSGDVKVDNLSNIWGIFGNLLNIDLLQKVPLDQHVIQGVKRIGGIIGGQDQGVSLKGVKTCTPEWFRRARFHFWLCRRLIILVHKQGPSMPSDLYTDCVSTVKRVLSEVTAGQKNPFRPAIEEWNLFMGALATANREMEELEEVSKNEFEECDQGNHGKVAVRLPVLPPGLGTNSIFFCFLFVKDH